MVAPTQLGGNVVNERVLTEAPAGSIRDGIADIRSGIIRWPVWWTLTWHGIRSQYRRTYLGPWWMTLQQVIFVAGLSLLFGVLLGQDLQTFVPYVAIGFMVFTWMTGMLQSGASCMVDNGANIKTAPNPLSTFPLRAFATNTIQFGHDALIIVAVIVIFQVHLTWSVLLLPISLALVAVNGIAVGLWLGPVVARYRDVGQIVSALTRVLFFFTPVFWVTSDLTNSQIVALSGWNPFAYLLTIIRAPLLGEWPSMTVVMGTLLISAVNLTAGVVHFSRTRDRLAYWL